MKAARADLLRAAICTAVFLALQPTAFADMKGYNEAVRKGDYAAAAVQAEDAWKTWDKKDPDTAVVAQEFGFASLAAGKNEQARDYARFLIDNGATLTKPDAQPLASKVLYAVADYKIGKTPAQLEALRAALFARSEAPGAEMASVLAWELLYFQSWNTGDWADAEKDATGAAAFFARQPQALLSRQRQAEVTAAATQFISGRARITKGRNNLYDTMADLHDRIVMDIIAANSQAKRNELWPHKWRAEAWALAIHSYLDSTYAQIGSNISTNLEARSLLQPTMAPVPEAGPQAELPLCEGSFTGKPIRYPAIRAFSGLVGSVIARMETDETGKVTKVQVVAAVPSEGFGATVEKALSSWSFKRSGSEPNCRVASKNHIYKVMFGIE